jgi:hypothetical protein
MITKEFHEAAKLLCTFDKKNIELARDMLDKYNIICPVLCKITELSELGFQNYSDFEKGMKNYWLGDFPQLIVKGSSLKALCYLESITPLIKTLDVIDSNIKSLSGIEYLTNLYFAHFTNVPYLSDISAIQNCKKLECLTIENSSVTDTECLKSIETLYATLIT